MPDSTGIELIRPDWQAPANVLAFTSTRKGGCSDAPWDGLNLGTTCGDDPRSIRQNRQLLRSLLPSEPHWLAQVHGNRVINREESGVLLPKADAITSRRSGQVCAVLSADCLPVLFCNRDGTRIAAAHAGWRGLAAGILEATVSALDCDPCDLMAWLGPAIGPSAFEVGHDVHDTFMTLNIENSTAFKTHGDRWLADLYELARLTLAKAGIEQVSGGQYCTFSDSDRFYSYRRDHVTGRMASVIWLQ